MGSKIIAFSLWGDNPLYNVGAIRNAQLMMSIYPGWSARFYIGSDVPEKTIDELRGLGVDIVDMTGTPNDWQGMFWRFYAVSLEEDIDYVLFRDTDSRISVREHEAVREWIQSDKTIHIMRDHPYHTECILAGMWGCKPKELIDIINRNIYEEKGLEPTTNLQTVIGDWLNIELGRTARGEKVALKPDDYSTKGIDQRFLRAIVYPLCVAKNAHIHDSYPMYNAWSGRFDWQRERYEKEMNTGFPSMRGKDFSNFIGQVYDEHDQPNEEYTNLIKKRDEIIYRDWG